MKAELSGGQDHHNEHFLLDFEWTIYLIIEFFHWLVCFDVGHLQPDLVSFRILFQPPSFSVVELSQWDLSFFMDLFILLVKSSTELFLTNPLVLTPFLGCWP